MLTTTTPHELYEVTNDFGESIQLKREELEYLYHQLREVLLFDNEVNWIIVL